MSIKLGWTLVIILGVTLTSATNTYLLYFEFFNTALNKKYKCLKIRICGSGDREFDLNLVIDLSTIEGALPCKQNGSVHLYIIENKNEYGETQNVPA